ncbi:hypothetical protein [Microbacterium rhizomatis]|uniref:Uncharacterized protein n=1 Tax=Microbacterium rhizomatis TaxID=1631477 RepID=A0A5J5J214_9MICO|nr:hypothetical protein [Microbacterium rhizomatis]KAA9110217.1 hypothetical protein F6B43_00465 [Microbacterium rhizomatis]
MDADAEAGLSPVRHFARALFTEDAIYGLILVSGMIVISAQVQGQPWAAFFTVLVTVVVFWIAHVYSQALALYARHRANHNLWRAIGDAMYKARGMLVVSVPALVLLLAGSAEVVDDELALTTALVVNVVLLALVGWIAVARWSTSFWARTGGALLTAAFGLVLTVLKAFVHH